MQIVIDIDDHEYTEIKEDAEKFRSRGMAVPYLYKIIVSGVSLLKGHGRLIDADEAIKTLKSLGSRDYRREKGTIQEAIKMLSYEEYTPTIIEVNKES